MIDRDACMRQWPDDAQLAEWARTRVGMRRLHLLMSIEFAEAVEGLHRDAWGLVLDYFLGTVDQQRLRVELLMRLVPDQPHPTISDLVLLDRLTTSVRPSIHAAQQLVVMGRGPAGRRFFRKPPAWPLDASFYHRRVRDPADDDNE